MSDEPALSWQAPEALAVIPMGSNIETSGRDEGVKEALRKYNAAKDTAVALLGFLAEATGETTREVFKRFGVSDED